MAGQIKKVIDQILIQRSGGDEVILNAMKLKLILKGLDPDKFDDKSADEPAILEKLKIFAKEFNVQI